MKSRLLVFGLLVASALALAPTASALDAEAAAAAGKCNGTVDTNCTCTNDLNGCITGEKCTVYVGGVCYVG